MTKRRSIRKAALHAAIVNTLFLSVGQALAQQSDGIPSAVQHESADSGTIIDMKLSMLPPLKTEQAQPLTGATAELARTPDEKLPDPANSAVAAAVADGVSTGFALASGAVETNPLLSTSPLGVIATTALKVGFVKYAETWPTEEKRLALKATSAFWGGAAVNNLLVLMAASPPTAIVAGLVAGILTWNHMQDQYEKEDEMIALREKRRNAEPEAATPVSADASTPAQKPVETGAMVALEQAVN